MLCSIPVKWNISNPSGQHSGVNALASTTPGASASDDPDLWVVAEVVAAMSAAESAC